MKEVNYLVLGGGIAGTTAAEEIRSKDPTSSITILTEEPNRLYSRVLLPHFLRDENTLDSLFVRKAEAYTQKNIDLVTSTKVTSVDTANKSVTVASGEIYKYQKLLIATGGKLNKLAVPGGELPEITYLRTLEDAKRIREIILKSTQGIVLGGGFIGIEFAQSFIKHNLKTTAIIREKSFWEIVVGENSAKLLSQILVENGVTLIPETQVTEFVGEGNLKAVKTDKGAEIAADIVGVGIGIHMEVSHLQNSGLDINKGILTNEYLETSVPSVWAAGDIAEFYDSVYHRHHQVGNWANSSSQGRIVGLNMAGTKTLFETASMYSISVFSNNFSVLGDPTADENTEVIERGSLQDKKIARLLLRDDIIVGASLINLPIDRNQITKLIKNRTKVTPSKEKLADLGFDLGTLVT
jgi:NAD(P)H-nitrite reductase large subunit